MRRRKKDSAFYFFVMALAVVKAQTEAFIALPLGEI